MPAGVAPVGSANGEVLSSVRLPPLTANAPTLPIRLSSTYRNWPSGLSRASTAPTPPVWPTGVLPSRVSDPFGAIEKREISPDPVFTVNRNWPSWVISIASHHVLAAGGSEVLPAAAGCRSAGASRYHGHGESRG